LAQSLRRCTTQTGLPYKCPSPVPDIQAPRPFRTQSHYSQSAPVSLLATAPVADVPRPNTAPSPSAYPSTNTPRSQTDPAIDRSESDSTPAALLRAVPRTTGSISSPP